MKRLYSVSFRKMLALFVVAALSAPTLVMADDMTFGEEEGTDTKKKDDMTFGEEEGTDANKKEEEKSSTKGNTMSVLALPSKAITKEQRTKLQSAMMKASGETKKYSATGGSGVLSVLEENDLETCVREQLCLGSVGRESKVDYILTGRVSKAATGYSFTLDLFDVKEKLFIKSKTYNKLSDFDDVLDMVTPASRSVFDIRVKRDGPKIGTGAKKSTIQTVFAYTTAGLAVACIGGGIFYGLDASAQEDELKNSAKEGSRYKDLTQRQARERLNEIEGTATTANVFYGLGIALGAASAALFLIDFGSDVDETEQYGVRQISVTPTVSTNSVGVGTMFRF